jgi:adenylate kinase family enzyme
VIREDDQESVIRQRLDAYEKQTRPLIDYLREKGRRLHEVNAGGGAPEILFQTICGLISQVR